MKKLFFLALILSVSLTGCGQKNHSEAELLEGIWQDTEDPNSFLAFEDGKRKEMYVGVMDWVEEPYTLSEFCTNDTDKDQELPHEANKYISCNESNMCWYIVKLDKENLVLSYVGRGNTLSYKRVEKAGLPVVSGNGCEDFDTFLAQYSADFEFQKSRTIFPFINEFFEHEEVESGEGEIRFEEKTVTKETSIDEWTKLDFTWNPEYATREIDTFTQEIIAQGDTVIIQYNGVENGINVQSLFICKEKKWYLLKTIDRSM